MTEHSLITQLQNKSCQYFFLRKSVFNQFLIFCCQTEFFSVPGCLYSFNRSFECVQPDVTVKLRKSLAETSSSLRWHLYGEGERDPKVGEVDLWKMSKMLTKVNERRWWIYIKKIEESPVWPVKSSQMSIKVPQKRFH